MPSRSRFAFYSSERLNISLTDVSNIWPSKNNKRKHVFSIIRTSTQKLLHQNPPWLWTRAGTHECSQSRQHIQFVFVLNVGLLKTPLAAWLLSKHETTVTITFWPRNADLGAAVKSLWWEETHINEGTDVDTTPERLHPVDPRLFIFFAPSSSSNRCVVLLCYLWTVTGENDAVSCRNSTFIL